MCTPVPPHGHNLFLLNLLQRTKICHYILVLVDGASAEGQADGGDAGGEGDGEGEGDDGKVVLLGVGVVAGVPHEGGGRHAAARSTPGYFK